MSEYITRYHTDSKPVQLCCTSMYGKHPRNPVHFIFLWNIDISLVIFIFVFVDDVYSLLFV